MSDADDGRLRCECCVLSQTTTRKYPGIGYWCDTCMNDGCFSDDIDAQDPSGHPPYYERRDANHARLRDEQRPVTP